MSDILDEYFDAEIIVGDARGLDRIVRDYCGYDLSHPNVVVARWESYGKIAGHVRNRQMLELLPDLVIAFPGGKGTRNCVRQAKDRGIEVRHVGLV